MHAIDRLIEQINIKQAPVVVGLDPLIDRIPLKIKSSCLKQYGNTVQAATEALFIFNREILSTIHHEIPAVKLQMACYELYGSYGLEIFYRTVHLAKSLNLIVIDDSKLNDIGSSAKLYARGHLGRTPLLEGDNSVNEVDFLTVNPWLGQDGIQPFIEECIEHQKGIFILTKTSNPSSGDYQDLMINQETLLYQKVAEDINQYAKSCMGNHGYSSIGAVVGATYPNELEILRGIMPNVFFLIPGYGAQGGTGEKLSSAFDQQGYGALINSSRGIIFANLNNFPESSLEAVRALKKDLQNSIPPSIL